MRVHKHWLRGPRAGSTEVLLDALPGFPDGLARASDGNFWLAIIAPARPLWALSRLSRPARWALAWLLQVGMSVRRSSLTDNLSGAVAAPAEDRPRRPPCHPFGVLHFCMSSEEVLHFFILFFFNCIQVVPVPVSRLGLVAKVSPEGEVLQVLMDPGGRHVSGVSGVAECGGRLYMGHLTGSHVSMLELSGLPEGGAA